MRIPSSARCAASLAHTGEWVLVFRGFIINIGVRLMGARMAWPLAVLGSVVLGLSHLYQGAVGVVTTALVSFMLAIVFIASRGNLILTMLVRGFVNTLSLTLALLGLARLV
jgi:hypothetical protein